jgi:hypothetical protein
VSYRKFAEIAGLPMDKFKPLKGQKPPVGPQLPVYQPKTGETLVPSGRGGDVKKLGGSEMPVPQRTLAAGEITVPQGGSVTQSVGGAAEPVTTASGEIIVPERGSVTPISGGPSRPVTTVSSEIVGLEVPTSSEMPNVPRSPVTGIAATGVNVLSAIGTIEFAYDFQKWMDWREIVRSGKFFEDLWTQVGSLQNGAKFKFDGISGTIVRGKERVAIEWDDGSAWEMTFDPKTGGFGMKITGWENGMPVNYEVNQKGITGGTIYWQ